MDGKILFIQADPALMTSAKHYYDAANEACRSGCIQVAFFHPGDLVPPSGSRANFFRQGGWKGYDPVAIKFGKDFTEWDCDRLPSAGAPSSALCGSHTREAYSAVLAIAVRDGWTTGCDLEATDGYEAVKAYAASLENKAEAENVLEGYRTMYDSSRDGPDDPAFCRAGREDVEQKAAAARELLMSFQNRD